MSRKEKIPSKSEARGPEQPDEQVIIDLMAKRKLQQDALKKIITSMDKSSDESSSPPKDAAKERKQDQTKLI
jgi:hypothetical protein